jgi:TPP-dependent pyruvate/acetoin dehydrogenase alpha subunit
MTSTAVAGADTELYCDLYRTMVLIRRFEEAVQTLFLRGEVYGSTHLCIGQEAVSAGAASVLGPDDWIACTYRGHGHVLARGSEPQGLMDEMLGRATGTCGGRAGSMNVVDLSRNIVGCFGIVGGSLAAATGVGLALKRKAGVAVAFFGDGTANQGYFHECLNFAKVQALPVVYVCENNGYGEYTPTAATTPGGILARPRALDIPAVQVDGQDLWAVRTEMQRAVTRARSEGPVFVEALTYRYSDHGRGDPVKYRPEGEMERWRQRDPLDIAARRLGDEHGVSPDRIERLAADAAEEIDRVCERALAAPFPDPASFAAAEFAA